MAEDVRACVVILHRVVRLVQVAENRFHGGVTILDERLLTREQRARRKRITIAINKITSL